MMMCADGSEGSIRRTDRERMTGIDNCLSAKKAGKSVRRRTAIFGATPWRLLAVLSMLIALFLCAAASREGSYGSAEAAASSTESDSDDEAAASWLTRRLSKNRKHKHNEEEPIDYTEFSCDSLPTMRAKFAHNRVYKFSPCEFAHRCNDGEGIIFPSLFCGGGDVDVYDAPSESNGGSRSGGSEQETDGKRTRTTDYLELRHVPLLLFLSFSLLLLFRLLQSTTDEFFSPGLEMFSLQLGLPPRFAGVTLLALGNGAPDVAATMNAIINDTRHGYEMALGELTGTSMFVTSVILGTIVSLSGSGGGVTSGTDEKGEKENDGSSNADSKGVAVASAAPSKGNEDCQQGSRAQQSSVADAVSAAPTGVSCRGPLLRDIAVLVLVCVVSMSYLRRGVIDYGFVYSLLAIYGAYVLLVLVADCYHIFYHVPYVAAERRGSSELVNDLLLKEEDDLGAIDDDQDKMDGNTEQIKTSGDKLHSNGGSSEEPRANEKTPLLSTAFNRSNTAPQRCQSPVPHLNPLHVHNSTVHNHTIGDTFFEAMSNYSCSEPVIVSNRSHESDVERGDMVALPQNNQAADSPCQRNHAPASSAAGAAAGGASCGWAPMQDDGTEPLVIFHPHHAVHPHHGPGGLLFLRSKSTAGSSPRASQYLASRDRRQFSWSPDDNDHGGDSGTRAKVESSTQKLRKSSSCDASSSNATVSLSARQSAAPETMALHRNKDAMQISYRSGGADDASVEVSDQVSVDSRNDAVEYMKRRRPNSWSDAWSTNLTEFRDHWNDFFVDIYFNPENSVLDVILLSVELPFTIMRKVRLILSSAARVAFATFSFDFEPTTTSLFILASIHNQIAVESSSMRWVLLPSSRGPFDGSFANLALVLHWRTIRNRYFLVIRWIRHSNSISGYRLDSDSLLSWRRWSDGFVFGGEYEARGLINSVCCYVELSISICHRPSLLTPPKGPAHIVRLRNICDVAGRNRRQTRRPVDVVRHPP